MHSQLRFTEILKKWLYKYRQLKIKNLVMKKLEKIKVFSG